MKQHTREKHKIVGAKMATSPGLPGQSPSPVLFWRIGIYLPSSDGIGSTVQAMNVAQYAMCCKAHVLCFFLFTVRLIASFVITFITSTRAQACRDEIRRHRNVISHHGSAGSAGVRRQASRDVIRPHRHVITHHGKCRCSSMGIKGCNLAS